jgi:N-acetylglutamate synthase-like GNAT family acetyltransferase
VVEIGSLIVGQSFRGLGLSVPLVETTTINAIASGKKAIAFCNSISEKVFARVGYEPMKICKIPQEALTLCSECPKKPEDGGCCDRVYVFEKDIKCSNNEVIGEIV